MKTGVYFCRCSKNIAEKINEECVRKEIEGRADVDYFRAVDFLCSEDGKNTIQKDLVEKKPDRVVIAACSPRDHEETFKKVLIKADLNPYLMQMVNIREHISWVTKEPGKATEKAIKYIKAAIERVKHHEKLFVKEVDVTSDVLIIGGGTSGLKSALVLADTGRRVIIVEKTSILGGLPVRLEDVFPNVECGPCMLEPILNEVLHGPLADNIEIFTLSEISELVGSYGNFTAKIKKSPRFVDIHTCIGCTMCVEVCPVTAKNETNYGLSDRNAIYLPFLGGLPNVPSIDEKICKRLKGEECSTCIETCPIEGTINFDDKEEIIERKIGAVIVSTGASIYDPEKLPGLSYGKVKEVYTNVEFERILSSNGPTSGALTMKDASTPKSVVIIHCAGSIDEEHNAYCSEVCCQSAFKYNHLIQHKAHGAEVYHFLKEVVIPGKLGYRLYKEAKDNSRTHFIRYENIKDLKISSTGTANQIEYKDASGEKGTVNFDMAVLCLAVVPNKDQMLLKDILELTTDKNGFYEELHNRMDSSKSKIKGIFIAGACQNPMDIDRAVNQGVAVTGYILSSLVPGRKLEIDPVTAVIDQEKCSGCRMCNALCPYKAITFEPEKKKSDVNQLLCAGCGTCAASCPVSAISANHFTDKEIFSELEVMLS